MVKHFILFYILTFTLLAGVTKSPIVSVDYQEQLVTIKINNMDIGVSGFIVHRLSKSNSSILKNVTVVDYDAQTEIATLKMEDFDQLKQNALPSGNWKVEVGDIAILAFGYSRAVLLAPSEEIYFRLTRSSKALQWVHPDIFGMILSFNGHPTPLKEDFDAMSKATSVGLVFFYINKKLYTVDIKSMSVLNIAKVKLTHDEVQLPFYSRIEKINSEWYDWFDEGAEDLESYEEYYYEFLMKYNPDNEELYEDYEKYMSGDSE